MFKTTLYHNRDVGRVETGCAKRKPVLDGVYTVQYVFSICCILGLMSVWPGARPHIIANFASEHPLIRTQDGMNMKIIYHDQRARFDSCAMKD